jgi:hypothetical protein
MQKHLFQEAKQHFNEPILIGFDLCRCVGYAEDDDDCYLIIRDPREGLVWHTFVGGYVYLDSLKGKDPAESPTGEKWDDFTRLDSLLALNGAPPEEKFICELTHDTRQQCYRAVRQWCRKL